MHHSPGGYNNTECNTFQNLSSEDKIETVKQNGACYRCLETGHLSRVCSSYKKCDVANDSYQPCNKAHHPILHEGHIDGMSFHHARNQNVYDTRTLLMLSKVDCLCRSSNAILDPCSNLSLITHRAARKLNLTGKDVTLSITKVGNVTDAVRTKEYVLCLKDKSDNIWTIQVYRMDEITSSANEVDVSEIVDLFQNIRLEDIERPVGQIDVLLGLDCCQLLPNNVAHIGDLKLMKGPLGYCLRGSHPLLHFRGTNTNSIKINVHKTIVKLKHTDFRVDVKTAKDRINDFFNIESLGRQIVRIVSKSAVTI